MLTQKIIAVLMSLFFALSGMFSGSCGGDEPAVVPEEEHVAENAENINTLSDYDTSSADYTLGIDVADEIHDISELLYGIFFEDINFSADGGLYAEMVSNRSFEYTQLAAGDNLYRWSAQGSPEYYVAENAEDCLNENNPSYLVLSNASGELAGVKNTGFLDGMSIVAGKNYKFSVYAKTDSAYDGKLTVTLYVGDSVAATGEIDAVTDTWTKYNLTLTSALTSRENVSLCVAISGGEVKLDMISLFPEDTYKGRENGLRADLCELLEDLQPKFLRFPGGCVTEGENEQTQYSWKDSIATGKDGLPLLFDGTYGNVAARPQGENIWTDHNATEDPWPDFMTYGLGFYEYFLLAEDLGAVGVPVLDAGLYCQMRGKGPVDMESEQFRQYIQDMLDLVEFCRGDETTTWGKVRVSLGHAEPFELKYIGIGNENENEDYYVRYRAFVDAFNEAKQANPELYDGIELIYSSGAADATGSENYIKSYEYAESVLGNYENVSDFAGAIDQHYYKSPEWFLANTDYYDNYSRTVEGMTDTMYGGAIQVFLGEYAAQSNTLKAALSEAAYMTGLERNGDIVKMAAYAPLFASVTAYHWAPNLIWYNNEVSRGSVNYLAQKLFSTNRGTKLLSSTPGGMEGEGKALTGRVGLGTWYTKAAFDNLAITDNETGKYIYCTDFSLHSFLRNWENVNNGNFAVIAGKLRHTDDSMTYAETGDIAYLNKYISSTSYTYTVDAKKLGGSEGFLLAFAVGDKNNNWFWNIGGWGNTISCLQYFENGGKSGKVSGTVKPFTAEKGKTYTLKVVVDGSTVKCYIDDELYVDYDTAKSCANDMYQVVSTDDTGDVIIKLVNTRYESETLAVNLENAELTGTADVQVLSGNNLSDVNVLWMQDSCTVKEFSLDGVTESFNYTVPAYSVTVIRVHTK